MQDSCETCGREMKLTFHHLIPKTNHKNKWFKKNFDVSDMKNRGIYVCQDCHSEIHTQISEKDLGRYYNTLENLREHEILGKFFEWRGKH